MFTIKIAQILAWGMVFVVPALCQTERNAKQIALKRWYEAVSANVSIQLGDEVFDAVFDGSHVWATGRSSGNGFIAKVNASDGAVLLNIPLDNAGNLSYDGLNIWASQLTLNIVTKIRASDGTILGSFGSGKSPQSIGFDGQAIWVANNSTSPPEQGVTRLSLDGSLIQDIRLAAPSFSVAFDGENTWVTHSQGNDVSKVRSSDGVVLGTFSVGTAPTGIAFDGESIWVANTFDDSVTRLKAADGTHIATIPVGFGPVGVLFDGRSIWVTNFFGGSLTKISAGNGAVIATIPTGPEPIGMAFDGASVWVACQGDGTLRKH